MKQTIFILISVAVWISAVSLAAAATIPAGTPLVAQTLELISTHEVIGSTFKAELEQDVVINGKVLLRAGTPVTGVVETSLRRPRSSGAVKVNLKTVSINGRIIPVYTTGGYTLPPMFKTKSGITISGREIPYPQRTRIVFRLAQPLNV